ERLADRFLPGEPSRVRLGGIRTGVAVRTLGLGETAFAEARMALERAANARNFDQVDADSHAFSSSHAGTCAIDDTIASGRTRPRSTASGRNFPVRTRIVFIPYACAPAMSASMSSPTIHAMCASASTASSAASK